MRICTVKITIINIIKKTLFSKENRASSLDYIEDNVLIVF